MGLELGPISSTCLQDDLDVIELLRGEVFAEVGVDAGLVLERGEEALGVGLVVHRRRRRRMCSTATREGQDEEDEKETTEQDSSWPSREAQGQRGEDGHGGGDAQQRLVRVRGAQRASGTGIGLSVG